MNAATRRIGDIADQIRGVTYRKQDATKTRMEGCLPVLRAGNITDKGLTFLDLVYVPSTKISAKQRVKKNDILVAASSGSIDVVGKAARALEDFNGGFGAFCKVLRPRKGVDPAYFAQFFKTPQYRRRVSFLAAGANINNLRNEDLDDLEIPLPPLTEQKRIAGILDVADSLRAKRRESLAQLDSLLKSTFLDMFGDPVTNPMGWEVKTLGDVTARVTDGTHQSPKWSKGGIPFLFVSNIRDRKIDFQTSKFISDAEYELLTARCPIEIGDILYTTVGSYGNPAMVRGGMERFAFQRHIAHIKPNSQLLDSQFLEVMLDSPAVRQQADMLARGVAQKTLNLRELKSFKIFLPPLKKQQRFAAAAESVERQKARMIAHLAELDTLFASLQSRAFSGAL